MYRTLSRLLVFRARRSEARIQQMKWRVNYSDIVFISSVCVMLLPISSTLNFKTYGHAISAYGMKQLVFQNFALSRS